MTSVRREAGQEPGLTDKAIGAVAGSERAATATLPPYDRPPSPTKLPAA